MKVIKTDSLGIEILNSISQDETGTTIKPVKTKDDAKQKEDEILFEVFDNGEVTGYFTLATKTYEKWVNEYKLEGVEL